MAIYAIGDIHGCARALDLLLAYVQPQPEDVVVTLGDYVDRGPDSRAVLDRLIELRQRCKLITLKGNHDLMMLDARADISAFDDWTASGGLQTLRSYEADLQWSMFQQAVPESHWRFLESCTAFHEVDTHFFVHANAYPDEPLVEQPDNMLFWERIEPAAARLHVSGKIMICGHSSQRSGKPLNLGHSVCIDTWVYGNGWLTCLDVSSGEYWQANQSGRREIRNDRLEVLPFDD